MFLSAASVRAVVPPLACVAVVVLALLPAGKLPRVAGPCGQALCLCRAPVELPPCCESCEPATQSAAAPRCVTLSSENSLHAGGDGSQGMSLLKCLDAALTTRTADLFCVTIESDPAPQACLLSLTSTPAEVSVPPPRA